MQRLAQQFEPNPNNPVQTPHKRHGFMFRADLDQFSARVATAMSSGDAALSELVKEFHVSQLQVFVTARLHVGNLLTGLQIDDLERIEPFEIQAT